MRTLEIPRREWESFLKEVDQRVNHRAVRLDVENIELGDQEMVNLLPLQGLDVDLDESNIEIMAGERDEMVSHRIEQPVRLHALVNDDDEIECIDVEDAGGGKTIIYFQELPALPQGRPSATPEQPAAH